MVSPFIFNRFECFVLIICQLCISNCAKREELMVLPNPFNCCYSNLTVFKRNRPLRMMDKYTEVQNIAFISMKTK